LAVAHRAHARERCLHGDVVAAELSLRAARRVAALNLRIRRLHGNVDRDDVDDGRSVLRCVVWIDRAVVCGRVFRLRSVDRRRLICRVAGEDFFMPNRASV
jgi:hypothetical protein